MASPGRGGIVVHAAFPIGVLAVGALIGSASAPGPWYSSLERPWFTPPGWVFGPVWTVLYLLIGWVGARQWLSGGHRALWALQMALNYAWSPVFFGLQRPRAALAIILGLLVTIALFIVGEWRRDPLSARLFLPYAAWVSLATCLNVGIVVLN